MSEPKYINGEPRCPICGSEVVWSDFYDNYLCTYDGCGWGFGN